MMEKKLSFNFFNQDALSLAKQLLGKVICHRLKNTWLTARIIETEAYLKIEKGSHASLGFTKKREALFMPPGTIYMYYARGGDSLNFSAKGEGNAVLIKSAFPYSVSFSDHHMIKEMQSNNPHANRLKIRSIEHLCKGQTLLCKSLGLKVPDYDKKQFNSNLFLLRTDDQPQFYIQTTRLGIPHGRDEDLPYRFIDADYARFCTKNPLTMRIDISYAIYSFADEP